MACPQVFYRENRAGYLSVLPFALAQAVAELPYLLAQNCLYCFVLFWMAGFASTPGDPFSAAPLVHVIEEEWKGRGVQTRVVKLPS